MVVVVVEQPGEKKKQEPVVWVWICGCGEAAGVFVAKLFSPLCRGLLHRHLLDLQLFRVNGWWTTQRDLAKSASVDHSWE